MQVQAGQLSAVYDAGRVQPASLTAQETQGGGLLVSLSPGDLVFSDDRTLELFYADYYIRTFTFRRPKSTTYSKVKAAAPPVTLLGQGETRQNFAEGSSFLLLLS